MNTSEHPATVLKQKYVDVLRDSSAKAEKDSKLARTQINLINEQNWFRMLAPSVYGGMQLALPDALHLMEALAWADGSAGWAITRCAIAAWSSGFFNPELAKKILGEEKACVAGGSTVSGTAEQTKDGYRLAGKWNNVTGATESTAFLANYTVTNNGVVKDGAGKPDILSFILSRNEFTVLAAGSSIGLNAASCHDIEVNGAVIPADRAFKTGGEHAKVSFRLYQYPLTQLSEAAMAMSVCGMAVHFTDICRTLLHSTKGPNGDSVINDNIVSDTLEKYTHRLTDARTKLLYAADLTWQSCVNQQPIKDTILYKVSAAAQDVTRRARECADALMPFCGIAAMDRNAEINRVWRDLHTAGQEPLIVFGTGGLQI